MAKIEKRKTTELSKEVEIQHPTKFSRDDRPTLVGFFGVRTVGLPVYGKVTLTEPKNDEYNVMFPSKKGKEGDIDPKTKKQKYYNHIYPITAEGRKNILEATLGAFEEFAEKIETAGLNLEKDEDKEALKELSASFEKSQNGVNIKYPWMRENFPSQIGDASFNTTQEMVLSNLELHKKDDSYFVVYPSASVKDPQSGEYKKYPHCGPMNPETAEEIVTAAVKAFEELQ